LARLPVRIYNNYGYDTEAIAAAIHNGARIVDAVRAGAHIVTAGFVVWQGFFDHLHRDWGLKIFADAWDATPEVEA